MTSDDIGYTVNKNGIATQFIGKYGKMYANCFKKNEFYEQVFLDYIQALNISGVYLDIGSNVGNHALFFSQHCMADKVYAFEPIKKYYDYVACNIKANELENVQIFNFGLSDTPGKVEIILNNNSYEIKTKRLDDLDAIIQGKIELIKIDVEGMEELVIRGGANRISLDKPIIFAEANNSTQLESLQNVLINLGYYASGKCFNASPTYEFLPLN